MTVNLVYLKIKRRATFCKFKLNSSHNYLIMKILKLEINQNMVYAFEKP